MPSSYTTSLRLTLPATGELSGTWGTTVNTGITELLDASVAGTTTISTWGGAGVPYTLSNNSGTTDEARRMFITATGAPGEAKNVICPAVSKLYFFRNNTTGGFALTLKTPSGTGIAVPAGESMVLYCDGTNVVDAVSYFSVLDAGQVNAIGTSTTALVTVNSTSVGASSFNGSGAGLQLLAAGMSTTSKYTPAIKFGSTDSDFTTTNPKFGAAIIAEAVEAYAANTNGGMTMSFWTAPASPGTGSGLVERMNIESSGAVNMVTGALLLGTTAASFATLDLRTSATGICYLRFQDTDTNVGTIQYDHSTDQMSFRVNDADRLSISSVGTVTLAATSGLQISRTAVTTPAATDGNVFSGTYTPTLTNGTNVTATTSASFQYMRVGDVVTVSGAISGITTTAAGNSIITMSLPIASNFSATRQLSGAGAFYSTTFRGEAVGVYADTTADTATFNFNAPSGTTAQALSFTLTYVVV